MDIPGKDDDDGDGDGDDEKNVTPGGWMSLGDGT